MRDPAIQHGNGHERATPASRSGHRVGTHLGLVGACSGSSYTQQSQEGDASADGGDAGTVLVGTDGSTGGDASATSDASSEASPPAPTIVYVSDVSGDNANDGLSPTHPKKTIAGGIVAATALTGGEVHVCKGVYAESALNLSTAVSLKGGYDCVQWTRTAGYGYPTFDMVNQTTIQNGNYAAQAATLQVSSSVPSSVVVDGFTIQGAPSGAATGLTVGMAIQDMAAPVVSNNDLTGGAGAQTSTAAMATPGSIGLSVSGSASPEVTLDRISGGTGSGTTSVNGNYGSAGVVLAGAGKPNLHDLTMAGGVAAAAGSVGLFSTVSLTGAGGNALMHATVNGADAGVAPLSSSVGIDIEGAASRRTSHGLRRQRERRDRERTDPQVTYYGRGGLCSGGSASPERRSHLRRLEQGPYHRRLDRDECQPGDGQLHGPRRRRDRWWRGISPMLLTITLNFDTIYAQGGNRGVHQQLEQLYGWGISREWDSLFLGEGHSAVLWREGPEAGIYAGRCLDTPPATFTAIDYSVFGGFGTVAACDTGLRTRRVRAAPRCSLNSTLFNP